MKFIVTKYLELERLFLRKLTIEDVEEVYCNGCSSEKVDRYMLWRKHENVEVTSV